MSMKMTREEIVTRAIVKPEDEARTVVDQTFELPNGLYGLTIACYLGFVGIMAIGFGNPHLVIPMVVFAVIIVAGFLVPGLWTRLQSGGGKRALDWGRLQGKGIQTFTGRVTAGEAAAQVLVLPILIFAWSVAAITIAVLVGD